MRTQVPPFWHVVSEQEAPIKQKNYNFFKDLFPVPLRIQLLVVVMVVEVVLVVVLQDGLQEAAQLTVIAAPLMKMFKVQ